MNPLSVAKGTLKAYSATKAVVATVAHPIQSAKNAIVDAAVSVIVKTLTATLGPVLAEKFVDKANIVDKSVPLNLSLSLPEKVASKVDEQTLQLIQEAANEAMAGPLELLGYRLGSLELRLDEERQLSVALKVGVLRI